MRNCGISELRNFVTYPIPQFRNLAILFWPDPGLSRNTRCRCYRCSVPGLAGFTRLALCGARDLIKQFQIADNCRFQIVE
jgi:hypothetical protein